MNGQKCKCGNTTWGYQGTLFAVYRYACARCGRVASSKDAPTATEIQTGKEMREAARVKKEAAKNAAKAAKNGHGGKPN